MPKTFPIELDEDLHKRVKIAAIHEGITLHDWIIKSLKEKLDGNGNTRTGKEERNFDSQRSRSR
jgi:hypothetical protein